MAAGETIRDDSSGVAYLPFVSDECGSVGYRCRFDDGRPDEYVYIVPSSETDDGTPNVFLYQGTNGDPSVDQPWHHYNMGEES